MTQQEIDLLVLRLETILWDDHKALTSETGDEGELIDPETASDLLYECEEALRQLTGRTSIDRYCDEEERGRNAIQK